MMLFSTPISISDLTLLVYLAMSAATSADVVGIWKSPVVEVDDEEEELTVAPAITVADTGVLVTRVTAEVEVVFGVSFCCTAGFKNTNKYNTFHNNALTLRWRHCLRSHDFFPIHFSLIPTKPTVKTQLAHGRQERCCWCATV